MATGPSGFGTPAVVSPSTHCRRVQQWGCEAKQLAQTLQLLSEMQEDDGVPSAGIISYKAAMSACADHKQWQLALVLLASMKDAGITPPASYYEHALRPCPELEQEQQVMQLAHEHGCSLQTTKS